MDLLRKQYASEELQGCLPLGGTGYRDGHCSCRKLPVSRKGWQGTGSGSREGIYHTGMCCAAHEAKSSVHV